MTVIELSPAAYAELFHKLAAVDHGGVTTTRLVDNREAIKVDRELLFTSPEVHCPDCAARLQQTGDRLKFLQHLT